MVAGYGIRDNIEQAYTWLVRHYRSGDQIFVFGFSRGAYTARALTGLLRTVGLLDPDAENMIPYVIKLYVKSRKIPDPDQPADAKSKRAARCKVKNARNDKAKKAGDEFWALCNAFRDRFGNPVFPNPFNRHQKQVHFLGVWDTVKFVGWLNLKARIEVARWPFTANLDNVASARHALAIDERRRPFAENRFDADAVAKSQGRFRELWFAGVHGDIGGQNRDHDRLPDIAFSWMVKQAADKGMIVDPSRYRRLVSAHIADELPDDRALGVIRPNGRLWRLAGGWRLRPIRHHDELHPSVQYRIRATADSDKPYRPKNLPPNLLSPAD